jgi:hypothetical protein
MKKFTLALAAAGAIALAAPAPASANPLAGLKIAPQVDAGPEEVRRRCYHRRHNSRWRCYNYHRHHYYHRNWDSRRHWRYHYHPGPGIHFRLF